MLDELSALSGLDLLGFCEDLVLVKTGKKNLGCIGDLRLATAFFTEFAKCINPFMPGNDGVWGMNVGLNYIF